MAKDFLQNYLQYTLDTEATATFHRWSALVGIGAFLERNIWIQHGAKNYYPNHYVMLLGDAGSRKSSAIKGFVRILRQAGYKTMAAEKTSKEKFFADLAAQHQEEEDEDNLLWGDVDSSAVTPCLIAADEANDFFGINNLEFLSALGSMWDFDGNYDIKKLTSKSIEIPNPTISVLAGNTPTNFSLAFPPTIIGQGFFSRILLIHGEKTRPKIAWPTPPDPGATADIIAHLTEIKAKVIGQIDPTPKAKTLMSVIYNQPDRILDQRFTSYFNRRFTHLMKLCLVIAASKMRKEIDEDTVIQANTYLTYIQNLMPKALGEYGKSQNSDVLHKIMSIVQMSDGPVPLREIMKQVINDVRSTTEVGMLVHNLVAAEKLQHTKTGLLPVRQDMTEVTQEDKYVDFGTYLTAEELGVKTS